jgi:hypothetical protein
MEEPDRGNHADPELLLAEMFMGVDQDLAAADAYIRQANRRIAKERALVDRTANPKTKATVRDLIEVLTILRSNVEDRQRSLLSEHRR